MPLDYLLNLYSRNLYNQSVSLHKTVLHSHTTILAELYDHTDFSVQLCVITVIRLYGIVEQSYKQALIGRIVYASIILPAKLPDNEEIKKLRKNFFRFISATFGTIQMQHV